MNELVREVSDLANDILEAQWDISPAEALQIAVKIQQNRILSQSFVVPIDGNTVDYPVGLEAIAMALGFQAILNKNE